MRAIVLLFLVNTTILIGCGSSRLDKGATSVESAQGHVLSREYQRTTRYDCQNQVVSDKLEVVNDSKEFVEIRPASTDGFYSGIFKNLTNGKSPGCLVGRTKFNINITDTVCDMKVEPGVNKISYRFLYCDNMQSTTDPDGTVSHTCVSTPVEREQGELFIRVEYHESTRPGVREIHPTPSQCATQE